MPAQTTKKDVQSKTETLVREMLARVADKWTLMVIFELGEGELRFTRLQEKIGGVSQKMLTKTLRQLERDGLVTRQVFPVVPPHVEYKLTPLGESLGETLCPIWIWVEKHVDEVERFRKSFDGSRKKASA